MSFINPIWLWGFTALALPVAIHLLSRKEGKVISIGSIRHLQESNTAQFKSIRLNEILLLLLRCLLITLLVLSLAGTQLHFSKKNQYWVVVEKGLEKTPEIKSLLDTLQRKGFEPHLLAKNFPALSDSVSIHDQRGNYWEFAEELAKQNLDSAIVLTYGYVTGFYGERPPTPAHIQWMQFDPTPESFIAGAVKTNGDSLWIRRGASRKEATTYTTTKTLSQTDALLQPGQPGDSITVAQADTIDINIVSDEDFSYDKKIIQASIKTIQSVTPFKLIVHNTDTTNYRSVKADWIIWLSEKPYSDSTKAIAYTRCANQNIALLVKNQMASLYCLHADAVQWAITKRLHEEIALQENLNLKLANIIIPSHNVDVSKYDQRILPASMHWSAAPMKQNVSASKRNSIEQYLVIALFVTLLIERWLAYKRNQ